MQSVGLLGIAMAVASTMKSSKKANQKISKSEYGNSESFQLGTGRKDML